MSDWRRLLLIGALLAVGCARKGSGGGELIPNTVKSEPSVAAFAKVYPDAVHSIDYHRGRPGPPRWNSKVLVHGRYIVSMGFDVSIDASGSTLTATSAPQYGLSEVTDVSPGPAGTTAVSFEPTSQRQFDAALWKALEANGGDLATLGIEVKRDQPVANLPEHFRNGE